MKGKYDKIKNALPDGIDGVLITSQINQYYASGFEFTDGYVLLTRHGTFILCDFRYIEAAEEAVKNQQGIEALRLMPEALGDLLEDTYCQTVMFEDEEMSVCSFEKLKQKYPQTEFVPCGSFFKTLRAVKDDDEIENIRIAQGIAEKAFNHVLPLLRRKMTETELAIQLDFFMRANGASASAFETIAINGTSTSMPHGVPKDKMIENGFVTMDFGAVYNGYRSDMTRTVCIGKATSRMRTLYDRVLYAQLAALDYLKGGGVDCYVADKTARDILEKHYKGGFGHSLGHGVGLQIHESPRLSPAAKGEVLQRGNVVTVEPGVYLPGRYGVRIEDMVVVCDGTVANITECTKELIEIC